MSRGCAKSERWRIPSVSEGGLARPWAKAAERAQLRRRQVLKKVERLGRKIRCGDDLAWTTRTRWGGPQPLPAPKGFPSIQAR